MASPGRAVGGQTSAAATYGQPAGTADKLLRPMELFGDRMVEMTSLCIFDQTGLGITFIDQFSAAVVPQVILVDRDIEPEMPLESGTPQCGRVRGKEKKRCFDS